jgi:hypothetical protein
MDKQLTKIIVVGLWGFNRGKKQNCGVELNGYTISNVQFFKVHFHLFFSIIPWAMKNKVNEFERQT